jgi:tRNA A-37 threonylcarbamoyl transferase component Bud32
MAEKLAAIHDTGLAAGDFEGGANVLIDGDGQPWWIDLEVGWPDAPNADQAADLEMILGILDTFKEHTPASSLVSRVDERLGRIRRRRRFHKDTMHEIADIVADELVLHP